jgi:hypothetical protein
MSDNSVCSRRFTARIERKRSTAQEQALQGMTAQVAEEFMRGIEKADARVLLWLAEQDFRRRTGSNRRRSQ